MQQYLDLLEDILENGHVKETRTGIDTISVFGRQLRCDLQEGFPLLTTKKVHLRGIIHELLWFLKGDTNVKYLQDNNVTIWDEWAATDDIVDVNKTLSNIHTTVKLYINGRKSTGYTMPEPDTSVQFKDNMTSDEWRAFIRAFNIGMEPEDIIAYSKRVGDLGPVYGKQWRCWVGKDGIVRDQIKDAIDLLRNDPDSRRIIVSAWNVGELDQMALMPCHTLFQFYTREMDTTERFEHWLRHADNQDIKNWNNGHDVTAKDWATGEYGLTYPTRVLSCQLYQRSCDVPLGYAYNVASYSLLVLMICELLNMVPGEFIHTLGDAHIYENQMDGIKEQLTRSPRALPKMKVTRRRGVSTLTEFTVDDFKLEGYDPHPAIKMPVAV